MFDYNYSISSIVLLIFVSIALVLLFSFAKTYVPVFLRNKNKANRKFKRWFYLIEISTIIFVLIAFISYAFSRNVVIAAILLLVLLLVLFFLGQYFMKDYLGGLLIKATGDYQVNDHISVGETSGRITRLGKTQLQIKDTEGNTIYLPYNMLITKVKSLQKVREKVNGYSFEYDLEKQNGYEKDSEALKAYIQQLPWIHPVYEAELEFKSEEEKHYKLQVTVFSFDKKYYQKIENSVKNTAQKNQSIS